MGGFELRMRNIVALALACGVGLVVACSGDKTPPKTARLTSSSSSTGGTGGYGGSTTSSSGMGGTGGSGGKGTGGTGTGGTGTGGKGTGGTGTGGNGTGGAGGTGGGGLGGAGMGGAGGMMPTGCAAKSVNNCAIATAEDHTAESAVTVSFGSPVPPGPLSYSPACVKIKAGSTVTFSGDMATYAIEAGPDCTADTCAGANPIVDAGPVLFPIAGTFPYHCKTYCSFGMVGVVFAVP